MQLRTPLQSFMFSLACIAGCDGGGTAAAEDAPPSSSGGKGDDFGEGCDANLDAAESFGPKALKGLLTAARKAWRKDGLSSHLRKHFAQRFSDDFFTQGETLPSSIARKVEWKGGQLVLRGTTTRLLKADHAIWDISEAQVETLFDDALSVVLTAVKRRVGRSGYTLQNAADDTALEIVTIGNKKYTLILQRAQQIRAGNSVHDVAFKIHVEADQPIAHFLSNITGSTVKSQTNAAELLFYLTKDSQGNLKAFKKIITAYGDRSVAYGISVPALFALSTAAYADDIADAPFYMSTLQDGVAAGDERSLEALAQMQGLAEYLREVQAAIVLDGASLSDRDTSTWRDGLFDFAFEMMLPLVMTPTTLGQPYDPFLGSQPSTFGFDSHPYRVAPWVTDDGTCGEWESCPSAEEDIISLVIEASGGTVHDPCERDLAKWELQQFFLQVVYNDDAFTVDDPSTVNGELSDLLEEIRTE